MGLLINSAMIAFFIFFVYQSYDSDQSTKYISLDPTSGQCTAVPTEVNGVFLGTNYGFWTGNSNFRYDKAIYSLTLINFKGTINQYQDMMAYFNTQLQYYGEISNSQNLGLNMLIYLDI